MHVYQGWKLTFSIRHQLVTRGKLLIAKLNFLVASVWLQGSMAELSEEKINASTLTKLL